MSCRVHLNDTNADSHENKKCLLIKEIKINEVFYELRGFVENFRLTNSAMMIQIKKLLTNLKCLTHTSFWLEETMSVIPIHKISLVKNHGRLWKMFGVGRGQIIKKKLLQICKNLKWSQNFSLKMQFFSQKIKKIIKKYNLFLKVFAKFYCGEG